MDIHVQHLASLCRICEDEIEDHKHKVDTNRFVSEIHQNLERFNVVGFSKCSSTVKKQSKKEGKFQVQNDVFRYSLSMH